MDTNGSNREKQEDELIVLKSIFVDGIQDLRQSSTHDSSGSLQPKKKVSHDHKWEPLELLVNLEPQESYGPGKEIYVQARLYVKCGMMYPEEAPEVIQIRKVKGLSRTSADELTKELILEAEQNKGSEVIWTLVNHARIFLSDHNKPRPSSFYDEMLQNKQKEIEEKEKENVMSIGEKLKEEEEGKKILEERLERKKHVLKNEYKRNSSVNEEDKSSEINYEDFYEPCCVLHNESNVRQLNGKMNEFELQKLKCNYHDPINSSIDYECVIIKDHCNGDGNFGRVLVILAEWTIDLKMIPRSKMSHLDENCIKSKELSQLVSLNHKNILTPMGVGSSIDGNIFSMSVSHEKVDGVRMSDLPFIWKGAAINLQVVKLYCQQILEGLDYIHSQPPLALPSKNTTSSGTGYSESTHLTHGDLKHSNIIVRTNGQIKITGLVFNQQLTNIYNDIVGLDINQLTVNNNDMYRFGLIFLWMASGWKLRFESLIKAKELPEFSGSKSSYNFYHELVSSSGVSAKKLLSHAFLLSQTDNDETPTFQDDLSTTGEGHGNPCMGVQPSRVIKDFELIDTLGKGAFGIVYKVKHRLDERFYALKRISLSGSKKSEMKNKKYIRELILLSKLQHENIVRYFGTWIDDQDIDSSSSIDSSSLVKSDENDKIQDEKSQDELEINAIFTSSLFVPEVSSESSSDFVVFEGYENESNEDIDGDQSTDKLKERKYQSRKILTSSSNLNSNTVKSTRFLYIQMELCENNTLRNAIDDGLICGDINISRRKRLFREILEGLSYLHENGIIHRDLKPVNIFLDLKGRVKIGDLGLAAPEFLIGNELSTVGQDRNSVNNNDKRLDTGVVGTPLYMAPELVGTVTTSKSDASIKMKHVQYSKKIDMYSLGIVFFEMCYKATTGMERSLVLTELRKPAINFPSDADQIIKSEEAQLIKQLVNHNPLSRPSCNDILTLPYIPPPELQEREEKTVLRNVIGNKSSKSYKYMMSLLLSKKMDPNDEFLYNFDHRLNYTGTISSGEAIERRFNSAHVQILDKIRLFDYVTNVLETIFRSMGGSKFSAPTFTPFSGNDDHLPHESFVLMDRSGNVICPPANLRMPLARNVARHNLSPLRSFSIEKDYMQPKSNYSPPEHYEAIFDIFTDRLISKPQLIPELEIISLIVRVIKDFPSLNNGETTLKIGHNKIFTSILHYFDIDYDKHRLVFDIINESKSSSAKRSSDKVTAGDNDVSKFDVGMIESRMSSDGILSDKSKIGNLVQILNIERNSLPDLQSSLKSLLRKKSAPQVEAFHHVMDAINELKSIIKCSTLSKSDQDLSIKVKFVTHLFLSPLQYSDFVFQIEQQVTRNRKKSTWSQRTIIFAIGGRYDEVLDRFGSSSALIVNGYRKVQMDAKGCEVPSIGAVGISFEVDKLVQIVLEEEKLNELVTSSIQSNCIVTSRQINVAISYNSEFSDKSIESAIDEMITLSNELREHNLRVICIPTPVINLEGQLAKECSALRVRLVVILTVDIDEKSQKSVVVCKIFSNYKHALVLKKSIRYNIREVVDCIKNILNSRDSKLPTSESFEREKSTDRSVYQRQSEESIDKVQTQSSHPISPQFNLQFVTMESKLSSLQKKKYENTIQSLLSNYFQGVVKLHVIAVDLPFNVIKAVSSELDLQELIGSNEKDKSGQKGNKAIQLIADTLSEKFPRYRKHFADLLESIQAPIVHKDKTKDKTGLIVLISFFDDMKFVVLT